jgi:transposase-like protein
MKKRGRKQKCPYCGSFHTASKGSRRTVTMGNRPLRRCKDCGRKFTVHRRGEPKVLKVLRK